jgi:hypothetical protein
MVSSKYAGAAATSLFKGTLKIRISSRRSTKRGPSAVFVNEVVASAGHAAFAALSRFLLV